MRAVSSDKLEITCEKNCEFQFLDWAALSGKLEEKIFGKSELGDCDMRLMLFVIEMG